MHFLQIWILPARRGLTPGYEQKSFSRADKAGKLRLIGSSDGRGGSVTIHQDVALYAAVLAAGQQVEHALQPGRRAWLQVVRGEVQLGDTRLAAGDGAAITQEPALAMISESDAEVLLFDMG